ncbi:DNase I-like protein [Lentinus tigrinus ALCF2SS1-7]|uniref:DNase I-like protein n=1 Tax=Lentinus tigrinus ALCF2SS1-6 TaxID=1328759 RepID=A0A5C2SBQ7_9APHY|nr:DNase I-like protein [Lentinus tigrinus ALCF2SS1-6]RPD75181.1 DNase I-like protein [Lentinus tigrinus ALCF2SS1-7]
MKRVALYALSLLLGVEALTTTITDIQGTSFQSPLAGQFVYGVIGVVTAKDRYGVWIQGDRSDDPRASSGLRLYGGAATRFTNVGDLVSVSGRVAEYRSSANDLLLTEIDYITSIVSKSSGHTVQPLVLGVDRIPPNNQLSSLDVGRDGWLSIPNNITLLENINATLSPDEFGLDFWESLEGQLVTVKSPTAANFPDRFGSVWVYGDWPATGKNARGGLTIHTDGPDELPPAHPEAILIGRPLDATRNPKPVMGAKLSDITGIVTYQYGAYYILPLTAPEIIEYPDFGVPPSSLNSTSHACELRIGDYNVENMSPRSHHIPKIAAHVAQHLHTPDILFVQEIQDDSGARNDGTVSANKTLRALADAIKKASGGVEYDFINVEPEDNKDGGQPGGNIRVAYLWRPEKVSLVAGTIGGATTSTEAVIDNDGNVEFTYNPGRIDPTHAAWEEARKPLAAAWQTVSGDRFYTVNVHFSSKRDSSSAQGDARPPVNGGSERRMSQANVTATFVDSILALSSSASVIVAGDMNEYAATRAVLRPLQALLHDANDVADVPPAERYTYAYDQHAQEIDHIFVSDAIAKRGGEVEHVHVNTWARSIGERASDHDPTVARLWVCDADVKDGTEGPAVELGADHGQVVL